MQMRVMAGAFAVLTLAACASLGSQGPTHVDPVGRYTLTTTIQGTPVNGQMRIRGEPGDYDGAIYTDFTGELPFTSVTVEGNSMFMTADTPDGPVDIQVTFDGDTFAGSWALGAQGGAIQGRRIDR